MKKSKFDYDMIISYFDEYLYVNHAFFIIMYFFNTDTL